MQIVDFLRKLKTIDAYITFAGDVSQTIIVQKEWNVVPEDALYQDPNELNNFEIIINMQTKWL